MSFDKSPRMTCVAERDTAGRTSPAGKPKDGVAKELRMLALSLVASTSLVTIDDAGAQMSAETGARRQPAQSHPYVGMWITPDGHIRHELLPNGRYDEARGSRQSAYRGRYEVRGEHIDYWDDTGFTADGEFVDENTLLHGGMVFRRAR